MEDNNNCTTNCTESYTEGAINCSAVEENPHSTLDKIQIGWQLTAAAVGLPFNLVALYRLSIAQQKSINQSRVLALYTLLNVSNIAILLFHCVGTSIWELMFWWAAENFVCKLYKFVDASVFYLSSNATVSIAVDLCCSILFPMSTHVNGADRVRRFILTSVTLGLLSSVPQLFMWGTLDIDCEDGTRRQQCSLMYGHDEEDKPNTIFYVYSITHNVVLFWLPLCIISPCYIRSTMEVYAHYASGKAAKGPRIQNRGRQLTIVQRFQLLLKRRKHEVSSLARTFVDDPDQSRASLKKSVMRLRKTFGGAGADGRKASTRKKRTRVLTSSLLIVTAYILSWLPYQVYSVFEFSASKELLDTPECKYLRCLSALMILLGTLINPFLYKFTGTKPVDSFRTTPSPVNRARLTESSITSTKEKRWPGRASFAECPLKTTTVAALESLTEPGSTECTDLRCREVANGCAYNGFVDTCQASSTGAIVLLATHQDSRTSLSSAALSSSLGLSATVEDILHQINNFEAVVV